MFSKIRTAKSTNDSSLKIQQLRELLDHCDAVVLGAGAGLSTAAGFTYSGERFSRYFSDFAEKYDFHDMYSGGFYPYDTLEEHWAYWSRYIYVNRYMDAPLPVYRQLFDLVKNNDYFALTTNVDHCFQKAGFDKKRLFYTQGDYGLFQCSQPCHAQTYDNEDVVRAMVEAQGYAISDRAAAQTDPTQKHTISGEILTLPHGASPRMTVPSSLVPRCPKCGRPMTMNLRADDTFVEDEGWHLASERYSEFLRRHKHTRILFLELGVGYNTPGIIKYPFWHMTAQWENASYACLNYGEAYAPEEIRRKSVCINGDIAKILQTL